MLKSKAAFSGPVFTSRPLAAACSKLLPRRRQDGSVGLGSVRPSKSPFISASGGGLSDKAEAPQSGTPHCPNPSPLLLLILLLIVSLPPFDEPHRCLQSGPPSGYPLTPFMVM